MEEEGTEKLGIFFKVKKNKIVPSSEENPALEKQKPKVMKNNKVKNKKDKKLKT